ncbi:Per1-like protein [Gymnopilus junonius]|uniref:Post-GPI attachment to proteins factor 3 n=1 Tax=Gymnopilus junonius TaxID=109634 RepID=A0A9P5NN61_GYMJU|nr:Per1-like protein [Gymnopilus junonius]
MLTTSAILPRLLVILILSLSVYASSGDRSPEYTQCTGLCIAERCSQSDSEFSLSLPLRLTRWTCIDDCKYRCMHEITSKQIQLGERVHQYHGKWPFWRLWGMQEPASVAFSLLNLWAHARGAAKVKKKVPQYHPMRSYYLFWSVVSMNAWMWSSIFHTRDLPFTEKMDYFSAALAIMYALYYTIIRLFHLYEPQSAPRLTPLSSKSKSQKTRKVLAVVCTLSYVAHVSYLTLLPRFDYTYNMAFNLTLGLLHNALWATYALPASINLMKRFPSRPKSYRPDFIGKSGAFVFLTTAATGLELFDFPPWARTIDAHALWHLSTVPIALLWYDFLVEDSLDPSWRELKA